MTCPCGLAATYRLHHKAGQSLRGVAYRTERPMCHRCADRAAAEILERGATSLQGRGTG
jgi:hypothetical protein